MERKQRSFLYRTLAPQQSSSLSAAAPSSLISPLRRAAQKRFENYSLEQLDLKCFCGPLFNEFAFGTKVSSVPTRGRGMLKRIVVTDECICDRPRVKIICQACGFLTEGRVRVDCPTHKSTIFLMDMEVCGRCKANSTFLRELHMIFLKDSNNNNRK